MRNEQHQPVQKLVIIKNYAKPSSKSEVIVTRSIARKQILSPVGLSNDFLGKLPESDPTGGTCLLFMSTQKTS